MSQPALSRQIKALERLVGCPLLLRSTHRVELTLAGEALLGAAVPLLSDLDDALTLTRVAGGEVSARVAQLCDSVVQDGEPGLPRMREAYEALNAQFPAPDGTRVRPVRAGGVAALSVSSEVDDGPDLLHLRDGGYIAGSAFGYRPLAGALAAATGATVLLPDFRLAAEAEAGRPPQPGRAVLLCPAVDVVDPSMGTPVVRWLSLYVGDHPRTDPLLNLFEADLYPVGTHVFHLFWSFLPEAVAALEQIATFVRTTTTDSTAEAG